MVAWSCLFPLWFVVPQIGIRKTITTIQPMGQEQIGAPKKRKILSDGCDYTFHFVHHCAIASRTYLIARTNKVFTGKGLTDVTQRPATEETMFFVVR